MTQHFLYYNVGRHSAPQVNESAETARTRLSWQWAVKRKAADLPDRQCEAAANAPQSAHAAASPGHADDGVKAVSVLTIQCDADMTVLPSVRPREGKHDQLQGNNSSFVLQALVRYRFDTARDPLRTANPRAEERHGLFFPILHKPRLSEHRPALRDGGLVRTDQFRQIADAHGAFRQTVRHR